MKRNLILVVTAWTLVAASVAGQEKKQTDSGAQAIAKLQVTQCALKVSGMTCGGCAGSVKQALLKLDGVKAATVDYQTGAAKVEYDSKKTSPEKIVAAFNQAGSNFRVGVSKLNAK